MERPLERVVIVGSGNLAEALAQAVARSGLQLVQLFARNAARGEAVAALAGTQWTADPARLADADIYLISVSDKAVGGGSHGAAPASRSRRRPHRGGACRSMRFPPMHAAQSSIRCKPSPRGAAWIFRKSPSSSKPMTPPASRTRSLRPPSFAHGGVGRLGLPRQGAPRGGFRLQLRQPHVRRRRRHRPQRGPALRRSQTAPGRDRRQGTRRRLPGRRADRPPPCATTCPRWHATVHCSPPPPDSKNIYSIISNNIWEISKKI